MVRTAASATFFITALVLLLVWAFAFVLFQVTTPYIHVLLLIAVIFLIIYRIIEPRG
jgi:Family of unknown function (DUF5670)